MEAAVAAIEERQEAVAEIEQKMEEEFDYSTMKAEIESLRDAVTTFMSANKVAHVFRDNYKITLVRRTSGRWNPDKLRGLVPKGMWLKITTQTVNGDKIDDLVREGKLDRKVIGKAFEITAQKPHIRVFPYKEGQDADAAAKEEEALRASMAVETPTPKPASKRKKKA